MSLSIDYLLKDGHVIAGSGRDAVPVRADIAIEGDRIRAVGDLSDADARKTISLTGMCVCPGFIDVHSHSEFTLLVDGRAEGKICQGITTEINGNCGLSAAPLYGAALEQREKDLEELGIDERWNSFPEYYLLLEKRGFAVNFATLVGHGNLRASVVGYEDRPLLEKDRDRMFEYIADAVRAGARGMSSGLIYPPGIYSDTPELVACAFEMKKQNGIYTTHMRDEGDRLLESVDEVIAIAGKSGIHAHISHLKTSGEKNWGKLRDVIERISFHNKDRVRITCDRYPYVASSTDLDAVLPAWAFEGGRKKELRRLKKEQKRLARDIREAHPETSVWEKVVISSLFRDKNKWMQGKSLKQIGEALGKDPLDVLFAVLVEEELQAGAVFFTMNEENLQSILTYPYTMIGTDSSARSYDGITANGIPHPRGFGSFPRVLGRYVRELRLLEIGDAVYRMTGLPAKIFCLQQRGVVKEGYFADLTVFDPETVRDRADFNDPYRRPEGIYHVFVNGVPVLLDGEPTASLPGRVLK